MNWTLHLLADKVVEMEFAGSISLETERQMLKKRTQAVAEAGVVHPQAVRGDHDLGPDLLFLVRYTPACAG